MTTIQPSAILEEVKNLVSNSCNAGLGVNSSYVSLHKGIIKMYFEARKVEIDYDNKKIKAEIPISDREFICVSFECMDMAQFLNSCIKTDKRSLTFYQNVLTYYKMLQVA